MSVKVTENQFQIFCKVVYRSTLITLFLQVVACATMFWMAWYELPDYQYAVMLLGLSILASLMLLSSKKTLFKRDEVKMGVWGNTGIMHPLHINVLFWACYFFFELFPVLCVIWIYFKAVWL
jgi:hypothetical protein